MLDRRRFLASGGAASVAAGLAALGLAAGTSVACGRITRSPDDETASDPEPDDDASASPAASALTLFLAGDVMTGRGIDQIQRHSVDPSLHERWVRDARDYVLLAERVSGAIPRGVAPAYVWGDAVAELEHAAPDVRIINLETAVTSGGTPWPGKGIHYRMHPRNVGVLTAFGADVCMLGNNHVLDWGYDGLDDTVRALRDAGLLTVGAGESLAAASAPAVLETDAGRVRVFSYGGEDSGVPPEWAAAPGRAGVHFIDDFDSDRARDVAEHIRRHRASSDRVVVSLHWGGNWGYEVPDEHRRFAHALIDEGVVDVVYGHSSHHPKAIEVYAGRPILYGCGDFINDYEGISGRDEFRAELTLMYFPTLADDGRLAALTLSPMRVHRFRLQRATTEEAGWLAATLDRESGRFGTRVVLDGDDRLRVEWS